MIERFEHRSHGDRQWGLFSLENRRLRGRKSYFSCVMEGAGGSSWWYTVVR